MPSGGSRRAHDACACAATDHRHDQVLRADVEQRRARARCSRHDRAPIRRDGLQLRKQRLQRVGACSASSASQSNPAPAQISAQ
jgi:hypothetical protein